MQTNPPSPAPSDSQACSHAVPPGLHLTPRHADHAGSPDLRNCRQGKQAGRRQLAPSAGRATALQRVCRPATPPLMGRCGTAGPGLPGWPHATPNRTRPSASKARSYIMPVHRKPGTCPKRQGLPLTELYVKSRPPYVGSFRPGGRASAPGIINSVRKASRHQTPVARPLQAAYLTRASVSSSCGRFSLRAWVGSRSGLIGLSSTCGRRSGAAVSK